MKETKYWGHTKQKIQGNILNKQLKGKNKNIKLSQILSLGFAEMTVIDIRDEKKVYKEMSLLLWLMVKNWYMIEEGSKIVFKRAYRVYKNIL